MANVSSPPLENDQITVPASRKEQMTVPAFRKVPNDRPCL